MSGFAEIALFAWIPAVIGMFLVMRPRRAVITAYLFAWLFLPVAAIPISGLPDYTKMSATCVGVLLASLIFDSRRLIGFSPRWLDLPMLAWCLCPMASSLTNGLGIYDGASATLNQAIIWGLPYLIGRVYFDNLDAVRELAVGLFVGGVVYVPFCLFEVRMSPQLHALVYGYMQHGFSQTFRFGGWRPMVFLQHGLMVGMWMCMATFVGWWLWWTGAVRRIAGIPIGPIVLAVFVTAVLCKSMGALVLLIVGVGVMVALKWMRLRLAIVLLILTAPLYIGLRASGLWTGEELTEMSGEISEERAQSLEVRLANEKALASHAMERPVFGWGGWGRNRIHDQMGKDVSITDGFWIITMGCYGLVGLASFLAVFLLPGLCFLFRAPASSWCGPALAPAGALVVVNTLFMIDCIPNAMLNPVYTVVAGALTSCLAAGVLRAPAWHAAPALAQPYAA